MKTVLLALSLTIGLAACGEKPQGMGGVKKDAAPHAGTGVAAFTAPGWKPGDPNSWTQELKTRAQYGQNDYSRTN